MSYYGYGGRDYWDNNCNNNCRVFCPCDPRQGGLNSAYNNTRLGGYPAYNQGHRAIPNAIRWNGLGGGCCGTRGNINTRYY